MQKKEELKKLVCEAIDLAQEEIIEIGEYIWNNPETGYKEHKAGKLVAEKLKSLQLPCFRNLAITGCRADLDTGKPGPVFAVLGELDSIILPTHPAANPETGAAHACGHNIQIANLIGAAIGLTATGVTDSLAGKIAFIAVPAEEFNQTDFRLQLVKQGKIRYCGGKAEMIRLGVFDDVDAALLVHAGSKYYAPASYNGFVMKKITFTGKAAHAGLAPEQGVNALYAANVALSAINAQRETFRDCDNVRVHGIIEKGGDAVNVIPDNIVLEVQVRAKTPEAIMDASQKVDRAARAGAMALGTAIEIQTIPGFMPVKNYQELADVFADNARHFCPDLDLTLKDHRSSSSDMGDVSMIIPSLHPYSTGIEGVPHTSNYRIADKYHAYVETAKVIAMTVIDLLYDNAAECRKIARLETPMTKESFLNFIESMSNIENCSYLQ
ncbi:MAG: amidohydrolase [Lentisphaerae bacterium]|nr:amidohydrolase [Lentisphaerota bacterium]MCP4101603.1 amidohydrolase [Lentisphaerota bacterium]